METILAHINTLRHMYYIYLKDLALTTWINGNEVANGWINASTALDSFQQWAETNRRNLGKYDAIMAVTM